MRISDWSSDVCSSDLQLPPRAANALSGFADIVRGLRSDASQLPPAELVRKLNERSGLLAALRAQCKTEQLFKIRRGNLDELADWFEHAGRNVGRGTSPAELVASLALLKIGRAHVCTPVTN